MSGLSLFAADWTDLIPVAVFLIVGALSVINQFIVKWREQAQRQAQRGGNIPRPAERPKPAGFDPGREVEEFLRRVKQQGGEPRAAERAKPKQPEPERAKVRRLVEEEPRKPSKPPKPPKSQQSQQPKPPKPKAAETVPGHLAERSLRSDVAARHVQSSVELADERVEQQVHQHLDHRVSSLDDAALAGAPKAAGATPVRGGDLAVLLRSGNARQAVVLAEILRPPVERWQ